MFADHAEMAEHRLKEEAPVPHKGSGMEKIILEKKAEKQIQILRGKNVPVLNVYI